MGNKWDILTVLMLCSMLMCSGCSQSESATIIETEPVTETQYTTTQVTIPETEPSTTEESIQETSAERQAVEAICIEYLGGIMSPFYALGADNEIIKYENRAEFLMHNVETLPEKCLGTISGEEDLIEKAKSIWIACLGAEYIEDIESDYVEADGEKIRYERDCPPYHMEYNEEYDVWITRPNSLSGIREDGVAFVSAYQTPPWLIIRGEDGMILGAWIYSTEESIQETSAERQAVEAICIEYLGGLMSPYHALGPDNEIITYENDADFLMHNVETLPEKCLGTISGEEDLIEKARPIWIETLGAEYVEHIESDYVEVDGKQMRYERLYPPYHVEYDEEYDAWLILPCAPSGIREDGVRFATPSQPPYLIIRGEDGMILGALI